MNNPRLYVTDRDLQRLQAVIADAQRQGTRPRTNLDQLEAELARRVTVASEDVPGDVITLNSQVLLFDLDTREPFRCTLVLPHAADPAHFKVSILAPVGLALFGHRVGDIVEWPLPAGRQRLHVTMLDYQPEAAGNYSLPEQ